MNPFNASSNSQPSSQPNIEKIRVATSTFCECLAFGLDIPHLSIELRRVELRTENAAAISYTWGEFKRRFYHIGHITGNPSEKISLSLGLEWEVTAFQKRLVEISAQYGYFWMDQLCIRQNDEEIRELLAAIPDIYRTLEVVTLLPGSLCKCLRTAFNDCHLKGDYAVPEGQKGPVEAFQITKCLNAVGFCSYFNRIWTFQEFRYSSCVRVLWNLDIIADCVSPDAPESQIGSLSPFARLTYHQLRSESNICHDDAMTRLDSTLVDFGVKAWTWACPNRLGEPLESKMIATRLLLGQPLRHDTSDRSYGVILSAWHSLGELKCSATQNKDYVLSTWVDWEEYQIPESFLRLSVFELFQDALEQMQRKQGLFFPSHCPAGLMEWVPSGTFHWHFPTDQTTKKVVDTRGLYGCFSWENSIEIPTGGKIPMKFAGGADRSLWKRARPFGTLFRELKTEVVIGTVCEALQAWNGATSTRLLEDLLIFEYRAEEESEEGEEEKEENEVAKVLQRMAFVKESLVALMAATWQPEAVLKKLEKVRNKQHVERALYEIVCAALHLDVDACLSRDLKLMMAMTGSKASLCQNLSGAGLSPSTTHQIPCLGLARLEEIERYYPDSEPITLTIALPRSPQQPFYEALRVADTRPPEHRIFGVWVPTDPNVNVSEVGATLVQRSDFNAFLS